jgi:hypothetical protein
MGLMGIGSTRGNPIAGIIHLMRCMLCDHVSDDHLDFKYQYGKCHYPLVTEDGTKLCPCKGLVLFEKKINFQPQRRWRAKFVKEAMDEGLGYLSGNPF